MPKLGEMAQLSRPFQILLVVAFLFAGVWLFALRGHSSSTSGSGSSAAVTASAPAASAPASGSAANTSAGAKGTTQPTHGQHGSGSLGGLSHAIAKAHGAAEITQRNTQQVEQKSAAASGEPASSVTSSAAGGPSSSATSAPRTATSTPTAAKHSVASSPATSTHTAAKAQPIKTQAGAGRMPARQVLVERALDEGKIAVILFWNPKGTDDTAVDDELKLLEAVHRLIRPLANTPKLRAALKASGLELQKPFAAFTSPASQVASYGSITRGVQVYQTPTLLVVNKSGHTIVLTGVQDAFSIEQAIDEARSS
jgi:hypothetical protein